MRSGLTCVVLVIMFAAIRASAAEPKAEPKIGVLRISGDNTWEAYVNFQSTRQRRPSRFSNASDSRGPHEPDS